MPLLLLQMYFKFLVITNRMENIMETKVGNRYIASNVGHSGIFENHNNVPFTIISINSDNTLVLSFDNDGSTTWWAKSLSYIHAEPLLSKRMPIGVKVKFVSFEQCLLIDNEQSTPGITDEMKLFLDEPITIKQYLTNNIYDNEFLIEEDDGKNIWSLEYVNTEAK